MSQGQNASGRSSSDHQEDTTQPIPATEVGDNFHIGDDSQSEDQEIYDADDEELREEEDISSSLRLGDMESSEQESTARKAFEVKMPQPSQFRGGNAAAATAKPADNLQSMLSISPPRRASSSSADSSTSSSLEEGKEVPADEGVSQGDSQGNTDILRETEPSVLPSSSIVDDEDLKDEKTSSSSPHLIIRDQLPSQEERAKQESTVREVRKPAETKIAELLQRGGETVAADAQTAANGLQSMPFSSPPRRSSSSLTDSSSSSSSGEANEITVKRRSQDHQENTNQKIGREIMQKVEATTAQDNRYSG
ncbi:serine/arginine repetitive matrix protein 2-like [Acanthaster planci]|uniref:Serine/arginine repetitive matrix protein 2-like n=1 Tax=Acanthaster planci TaxID=133434 RepID=A0A8B7Z8M4_ACAPL|nr:serine/arginine repetitive matrix protein 2-like [Acanthaster planci]